MSNIPYIISATTQPSLFLTNSRLPSQNRQAILQPRLPSNSQIYYLIQRTTEFLIVNKLDGKVLQIPPSSKAKDGTQCCFDFLSGDTLNQQWNIVQQAKGITIKSAVNGSYLTVEAREGSQRVVVSQQARSSSYFTVVGV